MVRSRGLEPLSSYSDDKKIEQKTIIFLVNK
ncbi:hypothetical protein cce_0724 [Crocosphaera subtropica ATCC 51142]|uniref:Uncharacterized protein n=1 Tax=Crocosphaera subtropica (strain ATCC 51142 / BH68) TaxID=43989 RepID=B1WR17_CROS5|nr:hypothetical protein cce_0724 [Crocosphaera subtropica ATCC 51142]